MLFVLSLFVFGTLSISFIGSLALLALTLAGGVFVNVLTLNAYPPEVRLLGISGYVYLLAGFWFVSYLLIDRRRKILARLLRVIGVSLVILFPSTFEERISYLAHAHGFWIGVVMGAIYFYWFKTKIRSYEVMGH
jgi:rhomboid protease GluP